MKASVSGILSQGEQLHLRPERGARSQWQKLLEGKMEVVLVPHYRKTYSHDISDISG